jgi:hypothetical protein
MQGNLEQNKESVIAPLNEFELKVFKTKKRKLLQNLLALAAFSVGRQGISYIPVTALEGSGEHHKPKQTFETDSQNFNAHAEYLFSLLVLESQTQDVKKAIYHVEIADLARKLLQRCVVTTPTVKSAV